jgi:phosphatidate phosphatase APP1
MDHGPIASQEVTTSADGSFQASFKVNWENMCQHPGALHIAFGQSSEEHDLLVVTELLPFPPSPQLLASSLETAPNLNPDLATIRSPSTPNVSLPIATANHRISLTHTPIRVVSDIDDTIKLSNILKGARTVFRNVFVKEFHDIIIPGMGEWYSSMWKRGVRFHYVVSVLCYSR